MSIAVFAPQASGRAASALAAWNPGGPAVGLVTSRGGGQIQTDMLAARCTPWIRDHMPLPTSQDEFPSTRWAHDSAAAAAPLLDKVWKHAFTLQTRVGAASAAHLLYVQLGCANPQRVLVTLPVHAPEKSSRHHSCSHLLPAVGRAGHSQRRPLEPVVPE
jgi:hypothetical protein